MIYITTKQLRLNFVKNCKLEVILTSCFRNCQLTQSMSWEFIQHFFCHNRSTSATVMLKSHSWTSSTDVGDIWIHMGSKTDR